MSLLPFLFDESELWERPRRRYTNRDWLDNVIQSSVLAQFPEYLTNLNSAIQDNGAQISVDKDKFQANFDVQHFKPEEISVKVNEDEKVVTIEGKHEEKQDEHGQIYRHFVRRYTLPKNCDVNHLESKLSSDGVLQLKAPIRVQNQPIENHRSIPIIRTGQSARSVEKNSKKMDTE